MLASADKNQKIIDAVVKALPTKQGYKLAGFAGKLFAGVPLDDLEAQSIEALTTVLQTGKKAVEAKPRRNLAVEKLVSGKTLVTIVMSNRPFIVDSVLAELGRQNQDIQLVVHPIVQGPGGEIVSLTMVVLNGATDADRKSIKKELSTVIKQVRQVTDDWTPMLARINEKIAEFRKTPPPVPAEDLAESIQFLEWITNNNFTLLGIREYSYQGSRTKGQLKAVAKSALGILRDPDLTIMTRGGKPVSLTPEIRDFLFRPDPLIITKANARSRVHRPTHLDYIGIKRYSADGKLAGEMRLVGLFTSTVYTRSLITVPVLRHKANTVLENFNADLDGHFGKALMNILETWPRDEMFQLDTGTLSEFAEIATQLEERPRIRVLSRLDKFDRFVSVLVYVPRDRYDSEARRNIGEYLEQAYDGYLSAFYPMFLENGLTRVHFIIGRLSGKTPVIPRADLEAVVTDIVRTWSDRLLSLASRDVDHHNYSLAYQQQFSPETALRDASLLTPLHDGKEIALDFHEGEELDSPSHVALKLFHLESAIPLSRRVPLLENMGFHVIEESTFEITRQDGATVFVHNMLLEDATGADINRAELEQPLKDCLQAVWQSRADDDNFNGLVLTAGLDWKLASVFRAYARYLRQIRSRFTVYSMATTLGHYPEVTADLAALFIARFDPEVKNRDKKQHALVQDITLALENIQSSDDDRIIRNFLNLIQATLRTNFYATALIKPGNETAPQPVLAFKVDPSAVNIMPQPVPYREIFVSSPRVEGLHLRFGPVARGGLRWSDRAQDYRTEVLGLVKAQQVKNAVIVPVGSKGGFVPKRLPSTDDRNAWFEEGRHAYKIFISSLLSLTDNLDQGKVVPPSGIVRHDGDDPYFVVAADKGTSTFSDTANAISQERDFWLDDAFASGGSAGYDHKKMGITARGGWEAVKRHFREMNRDIQKEPFTAAGVGDMSGDVFGNGMLLSKRTRLIAAFDHRDIFIDPDPDTARSFKERKRLFNAGRSSWKDYNNKLISKGGGVYSRAAKKIILTRQAAQAIGTQPGDYTPQEVMNLILKAPIDLMWFGGIGTYIRARHESDADADDRSNDAIRVTARELRCKVIGEGANLGVTQPGRIEFNKLGGRCNSDAIDNSAGVNSSDVEVNIKIALAAAMKSGKLIRSSRNKLLESMTETVAELVLRNNYQQTLSISATQRRGMEDFAHQQRLMQSLEARNLLDRAVEDLPDDAELTERQNVSQPLTRAEIGVLLAYAKIVALDDLIATNVPDDQYLETLLFDYFPPRMQKTYAREITTHRLRREIIGTVLANSMVNRGGATFLSRVTDRTGSDIATIARAYIAVRNAFRMPEINAALDALDTRIDGDLQLELYSILQERVVSQTVWFVRYGNFSKGIGAVVEDYQKAVDTLMPKLEKMAPDFLAQRINDEFTRYTQAGVPKQTAITLARMPIAGLIPDILYAAKQTRKPLNHAAQVFFDITDNFRIGRMVMAARAIEPEDYYDGLALDRALQGLHQARRDIVMDVLKTKGDTKDWLSKNSEAVTRTQKQMQGIVEHDQATVSRLTVAANILADLARS